MKILLTKEFMTLSTFFRELADCDETDSKVGVLHIASVEKLLFRCTKTSRNGSFFLIFQFVCKFQGNYI